MDLNLERDCTSALGSLFQQIINDLKGTTPLWEDFVTKATKFHQCLRATIQAIAIYLDAFQKIADAATNSRGASKEIGTALTRVCLRHKAVESRLKTFTTAIMDCLVQPLQEKLEDWKRSVITIDKEHAKEYKRCRTELKKRSSDTLRLQKKARKGQSDTIQSLMDSHKQDVTLRRAELEEVEKKSLRSVMIEERLRYCTFVQMLQPVVKEECEVISELGHLQEAMDSIALVTKDPSVLPQTSEELIQDTKATMTLYPESPGGGSGSQGGCSNSLGSRKSSVCSISSMNSSGSSNSPGHHHYPRSLSQLISPAIRLKPGESSDSGFCSSPALTTQASTATSQSHAVSTWPPHSQDAVPVLPPAADRPHTISTAYEKGHQRPPLTVYTFQNPETILEGSGGSGSIPGTPNGTGSGANTPCTQKSPAGALNRPPLPVRCSSLERPLSANNSRSTNNLLQRQCPSPIPAHITKELSAHHAQQQLIQQQHQQQQQLLQQQAQQQLQASSPPPTYVNMSELANMAATKLQTNHQQQQQRPVAALQQQHSIDSISSQFSNDSTASGQHAPQQQQQQQPQGAFANNKACSHSASSSSASSNTPSLHSHPSIESGTVTTPLVGQTPTPSSGSSTPQNHYSPLLTNSPSSTAAGTPSGCSVASGMLSGFVYNVNSPTPPQSGTTSIDSDVLKITETDGNQPSLTQPANVTTNDATVQKQQQHQQHENNTTNNITNTNSQTNPTAEAFEQTPHTNATNSNSAAIDTESSTIVENDERSRASVLQKASMFEKQAAAAAASTAALSTGRSNSEAIYGTRRNPDEVYRAANTSSGGNHYQQPAQQPHSEQQEVDKSFEDSIQELNNLIGELDSFQREIDASKRSATATPTTARTPSADNLGENCGDHPFPLITTNSSSGASTGAGDYNDTNVQNTKCLTPAAENTVVSSPLVCPARPPKSPQCASNQTSGCGTDLSDAASDDNAADAGSLSSMNNNNSKTEGHHSNEHNINLGIGNGGNGGRTLQQYNSDSELSRCYVSETSSLAGGYENPTFAHFASAVSTSSIAASSGVDEPADVGSVIGDSRSLMAVSSTTTADDCVSHTSETYPMQQHNAYSMDNVSDGSSNVVVIYDHQIPITPDIDYVKQNSEIVVLRTKDPLQQQLSRQEMRELTQLPNNLCAPLEGLSGPGAGMMSVLALSSSSLSCSVPTSPPHTATVTPAKQRLSSFRASSEQQLQLLGCGDNNNSGSDLSLLRTSRLYANPGGVTRIARRSSINSAKPPPPVRRSSSVTPSHNAASTGATQSPQHLHQQSPQPQQQQQHPHQYHHLPSHHHHQQQHNTQQAAHHQSHHQHQHPLPPPQVSAITTTQDTQYETVDCLPPPPAYLLDSRQPQTTPPPPSAVSTSAVPSSSLKVAETVKALSAMRHKPASPNAIRHMQQQQHQQSLQHSPTPTPTPLSPQNIYSTTVKTISSTALLLPDSNFSSFDDEQSLHYDAYSYYNPYMEVSTQLTSVQMPLTNANSAIAYQSMPLTTTITTPPPLYYYDDVVAHQAAPQMPVKSHQQHLQLPTTAPLDTYGSSVGTPRGSSSVLKAASIAGHQPVSPSYTSPPPYDFQHSKVELPPPLPPPNPNQQRSLKQQQQQQPQQLQIQSAEPQHIAQATTTNTQYHQQKQNQHQQQQQQEQLYDYLPSHQPIHSPKHNQRQRQQQQQQQQQQRLDALAGDHEDDASVCSDNASFRTSSPGIYAQPKVVPSMSSFRSASPASNDHHSQHHHVIPPTQPKTNPNLIAQLNARLSKQNQQQQQQQQQQLQHITSEGIYGSTPNSPNHHNLPHQHQHHQSEPVYMRNYSHPHQQQQQQQHQQHQHQVTATSGSLHQQQTYDASYASSNIEKAGSIRSKTKAEFLENLNAKLAKQGLSGRAFAVRNLINSKALPDPRICHESLMDQIKRGATLKRNQKINDRSAPKIH